MADSQAAASPAANDRGQRLSLLINDLSFGGAERFVVDLADELARRGHRVRLITFFDQTQPGLSPSPAVECVSLGQPRGRVGWAGARALARELRADRPEALLTFLFNAQRLGHIVARRCGVPVVVTRMDGAYPALGALDVAWLRLGFRFADHGVANSASVRDFHSQAWGWPADKMTVLPCGLDVGRFGGEDRPARAAARAELDLTPDQPVFICVARLDPCKGHQHLVEAARLLRADWPDARWLVVGDGARRDDLAGWVADAGLQDTVRLLGARDDVARLLQAADIFVLPSLEEGFGLVLVEAMATALPVVATRVGGVPEVVVADETGLLVPPADPEALAGACAQLLAQPALARRLGQAGLARARAVYDLGALAEAFLGVIDQARAGRRR